MSRVPRVALVSLAAWAALCAGPGLSAAPPKSVAYGPHEVVAGQMMFLDLSDSVSDADTPLAVGFSNASSGKTPTVKLIKDQGVATALRVLPTEPGTYQLVISTMGKPAPDAAPLIDYLVWPLTVTKTPTPPPAPTPVDPDNPPAPTPTPTPTPTPANPGQAAGQKYVPLLAASPADGMEQAATMIAAGTPVKQASDALKAKFQAGRNAAFEQVIGAELAKIVPAGTEPTAQTKDAYVQLFRDIATGLRSVKP